MVWLKLKIRKVVSKNKILIFTLILGVFLYTVGLWQMDLIAAECLWKHKHWREILPFWYMWSTDAYVLFVSWIFIGYFITCISLLLLKEREMFRRKTFLKTWTDFFHVIVGIITGIMLSLHFYLLSGLIIGMFLIYQILTSKTIKEALFDISEFMIGLIVFLIIRFIFIL